MQSWYQEDSAVIEFELIAKEIPNLLLNLIDNFA